MKRIRKSAPPNQLTIYAHAHPNDDWDQDFRNHANPGQRPGDDYRAIKQRLVEDQGGLCAYCETGIAELGPDLQRVEHYHPKSDTSDPAMNWHLHWENIMAVCIGGEKIRDVNFPRPANLSCDAHKNHYLTEHKLQDAELLAFIPELINPLCMPAFPPLLVFDRANHEIHPDSAQCAAFDASQGLPQGETERKLALTLEVLNLNCRRLCEDRHQVFISYQKELAKYRQQDVKNCRAILAQKWFGRTKWLPFFTTRRFLLGAEAEKILHARNFDG
ncbi:MAG: hypothetical protein RL748_240 [Pseudomonadota bacterium]